MLASLDDGNAVVSSLRSDPRCISSITSTRRVTRSTPPRRSRLLGCRRSLLTQLASHQMTSTLASEIGLVLIMYLVCGPKHRFWRSLFVLIDDVPFAKSI
uniref:Uncharacterized protein n=1 Tax=Zea mays TaxID=4577 RepID=A0A804PLT3_MAIZE